MPDEKPVPVLTIWVFRQGDRYRAQIAGATPNGECRSTTLQADTPVGATEKAIAEMKRRVKPSLGRKPRSWLAWIFLATGK